MRKPREIMQMKERHYLKNREKAIKSGNAKGKVIQCTRCHAQPVKTTEFSLSDTYVDENGQLVHTKANYCHRCLSIAYGTKDRLGSEQEENEKGLERQLMDWEELSAAQKKGAENDLKDYENALKKQGFDAATVVAKVKEEKEEEQRKVDEWKRERVREEKLELNEKALWDKKSLIQILSPILSRKQIKKFQPRQNKDKKIGQTRVQEI